MRTLKLQIVNFFLLIAVAAFIYSCEKQNQSPGTQAVASLNVINALPTSAALIPVSGTTGPVTFYNVSASPQYGSSQSFGTVGSISYGANVVLTQVAGNDTFYLVQRNADTILDAHGKPSQTMFSGILDLTGNSAYSLFITGTDTTAPDNLFVHDVLPYHAPGDSTVGIRFVNLSTNSQPVSINIEGLANCSEVQSLAYKDITDFKNYAATRDISNYLFVVRDAVTGDSLTSYNLTGVNAGTSSVANTVLFKNLTIALIGQPAGGTVSQKCIRINNF